MVNLFNSMVATTPSDAASLTVLRISFDILEFLWGIWKCSISWKFSDRIVVKDNLSLSSSSTSTRCWPSGSCPASPSSSLHSSSTLSYSSTQEDATRGKPQKLQQTRRNLGQIRKVSLTWTLYFFWFISCHLHFSQQLVLLPTWLDNFLWTCYLIFHFVPFRISFNLKRKKIQTLKSSVGNGNTFNRLIKNLTNNLTETETDKYRLRLI